MDRKQGLLKFTSSVYGRLFPAKLALAAVLAAAASAAQFALTWYLGVIIDSVGQGLAAVLRCFWLICAAVAVSVSVSAVLGYATGRMTGRFLFNLRGLIGGKLCGARYDALEGIRDGDLLSIATNDIEGFRPWLAALYSIGQLPVKFLAVLAVLVLMSWKLSLLLLPVLPMAMLPALLLSRKLHALNVAEKEAAGKTTGFLNEALDFMIVVKSFCLESLLCDKNRGLLTLAEKARLRRQLREQVIQTFGRCLGHVINPAVFLYGAFLILSGELTIGQIVTVLLLLNLVGEALNLMYAIPTARQGARVSMERVVKILSLPDEKAAAGRACTCAAESAVLALRDVSFCYGETAVLRNVSLEIGRGEKIAVVGASGSGKTTLFKLLTGLCSPSSGSVWMRGADIAAMPADALRRELAVVTQESFLFAGTVRSNLLLARPGAGDDELRAACRLARIDGFIEGLENGYDTVITDIGTGMSKGQMQRINLARAFLRRAPVWLLDEPVSALDPQTQAAVMDHMLDATPGVTVVAILHGLTAPERFDRILVMDNGAVAGFGRHDALAGSCEAYQSLLEKTGKNGEEAA